MDLHQVRHDVRTPLGAISSVVYILRRRFQDEPPVVADLDIIAAQVAQIAQLLDSTRAQESNVPGPGGSDVPAVARAEAAAGWAVPFVRQILARIPEPTEILEWCCEDGARLLSLAAAGFRVAGVESDPALVRRAVEECQAQQPRVQAGVTLVQAPAAACNLGRRWPFAFWLASPASPLWHPNARPAFLSVVARHLEPGGLLAILAPHADRGWPGMPGLVDEVVLPNTGAGALDPAPLRRDLAAAGLEVESAGDGPAGHPYQPGVSPHYVVLARRPLTSAID